jgi:hypothetical protein
LNAATTGNPVKVDFLNGSSVLGTDNTPPTPFSMNWYGMARGVYNVSARVTDALGAAATSPAIRVEVHNMAVSSATSPTSVNLSTEGTLDWMRWGAATNIAAFVRKSDGSQFQQISSFPTTAHSGTNAFGVSWTSGTPTASGTNVRAGIRMDLANQPMQFEIPMSTSTVKTLKIYASAANGTLAINGTLDGANVGDVVASANSNTVYRVVTITFQSAVANRNLSVHISPRMLNGGNAVLYAATLR